LLAAGAEVVAVEIDPVLAERLPKTAAERAETAAGRLSVINSDALRIGRSDLPAEPTALVANLPYNVAVPVVMRALEEEPRIERFLVMVQREVGERLAARPGDPQFGAVSLRVAYRAEARIVRRVPMTVFWPRPAVESTLVLLTRRPPPVPGDPGPLFELIRVAFGERRKTMRNALIRFGVPADEAAAALAACGLDPSVRPEVLGLDAFADLVREVGR